MSQEEARIVFHVDLDAFYASVEQHDNPSLAGKPVIVGAAPGRRGVVSACSYEARRFGVRSAMPISQAYRRCPQGVYLPVRMERYIEVSRQVMGILQQYSPYIQQISVDEAFLDLSGTEKLFGPPVETGRRLKKDVKEKTGLVISVGIGPNKYLAKLATNAGKPDGLLMVEEGKVEDFLDSIPLSQLWGIGERTLQRLTELNITSVHQLRGFAYGELARLLGRGASVFLGKAVRGQDPGIFSEEPHSRSLSSETTFERDRKDRGGIERTLLELCHQVTFRMIVARDLLASRWNGTTPIRLIGIGFSNLIQADVQDQLELFGDEFSRKKKVEEAVLRIRKKMGIISLTKASLLESEGRSRKRHAEGDPNRPSTSS
jgi:DNA polymerase-4